MKTIKLSFVALATLVLGTVFFVGCSSDEENKEETNSQELINTDTYRITNENAFISNFYGTSSWSSGKKITTADDLTTYEITEII